MAIQKKLDDGVELRIWYIYKPDEKKTVEELVVNDDKANDAGFVDDFSQIKNYLKRYHVTRGDIEKSYDIIVKDRILKDWTKSYDSQFSPSDYSKIKVKKQWENWEM